MEKGDVSPTAETLGRLCAAYALPMSRLLMMVEESFDPKVPFGCQPEWSDPETGFTRRSVSPPAAGLSGEVMEGKGICHPEGSSLTTPRRNLGRSIT